MAESLSALSLFPATSEQIAEARRRTLDEWGKGLTLAEHLQRDANEDQFECSRDGLLITWVLAPREDPETLNFKCSCETFKRIGIVLDPATKTTEDVTCYAIASVFTPPGNRGKGYAHHMLALLHYLIADVEALLPRPEFPAAWGEPPSKVEGTGKARFSALWSDVGDFYSACGPAPGIRDGWVIRGTTTTVWDVAPLKLQPSDSSLNWKWLDDPGVSKLWTEDAEKMRQDMEQADGTDVSFAFLPTRGVASFQHRRLEIFLERLVNPPINTWGVVSSDNSVFATWTVDPRPPAPMTLTVTRIRAEPHSFGELVGKILEIAKKHDAKRIEVWNLPTELEALAGTLGAVTYEREEHLPAFKWYGKEAESSITWAFNER
ncbi:hypothetical protein C8J57DRAFT_1491281 [Mycena rebaudengoi]|nr:hypothetical protein C8J57DRAFT_1491281 [Mycena rebaudengoi]